MFESLSIQEMLENARMVGKSITVVNVK